MIPQELVNHIVWEVGNNEDTWELRRSALEACALTSCQWSFRAPSRQILFANVFLQEDTGEDEPSQVKIRSKLERFLVILRNNIHLCMDVKSLTIKLSSARIYRNHEGVSRRYNAQKAVLPSILGFLSNVQSLDLTIDASKMGWDYIDIPLQEALFRFCASRPIKQLKLNRFNDFPMSIITSCSQTTSLYLSNILFANYTPKSQPTSQLAPKLKYLTLGGTLSSSGPPPHLLGTCQCPDAHLDLSALQKLHIDASMLLDFRLSLPSVTHLSIDGSYSDSALFDGIEDVEDVVSLAKWQSLRVLEFHWWCSYQIERLGFLPLITPGRLGHANPAFASQSVSIDTFIFNAEWIFCTRRNEMERFVPSAGWHSIDAGLSTFPKLRTIKLNFSLEYSKASTAADSIRKYLLDKVRKKVPELLPSIFASKLIQVELDIIVTIDR